MRMLGNRITLQGLGLWPSGFGPDRDDVATTGSSVSTVPRHSKQPPLSGKDTLILVCLTWTWNGWNMLNCFENQWKSKKCHETCHFFHRKNFSVSWGKPERSTRISKAAQHRAQLASMKCLQHTRHQQSIVQWVHSYPAADDLWFENTTHWGRDCLLEMHLQL